MYRIILVLSIVGRALGQTGYECTIRHTNERGVCQTLNNCRHLIDDVRRGRRYTRCGFEGTREIVCCPPVPVEAETTNETPFTQPTSLVPPIIRTPTSSSIPPSTAPATTTPATTTPATTTPATITPPATSIKPVSNERISVLKCREYAKAVYIEQLISRGRVNRINRIDMCGHKVVPLIVGGEYTKEREFPHMALLGYEGEGIVRWGCGGSLISEAFVLTAAHCTHTRSYGTVSKIRLGELNYSSTTDTRYMEEFNVGEIINHPLYRGSSRYNDIALIRLDHSITISPFVRPACLPKDFAGPQRSAIATGWGTTEYSGRLSDTLQKVTLELFGHDECQASYLSELPERTLNDGIRDGEQLCAGSRTERRDTCQADSGGPLQVYRDSDYCTYTIIGVTSFGAGCGSMGVPGVYTRVFNYLDWIEDIVWS